MNDIDKVEYKEKKMYHIEATGICVGIDEKNYDYLPLIVWVYL